MSCYHSNNEIIFTNRGQFPDDVDGVRVSVSYNKPQDSAFIETLNNNYIKESITLSSRGMTCNHGQLVFSGNELNLARANNPTCPFLNQPQINQQMTLSYRTHNQTFTIIDDEGDLKEWRSLYKTEIWEVTVAGQPTTDFTIDKDNHTLSFTGDLGDNEEIAVTVSFTNN